MSQARFEQHRHHMDQIVKLGVDRFRIEALDEIEKELVAIREETDPAELSQTKLADAEQRKKALINHQQKYNAFQPHIPTIFTAEKFTNAEQLKRLCEEMAKHGKKHIEIMVIEAEDLDNDDLASVILMRAKNAAKKGNELILMSFDNFNKIMDEKVPIDGVSKLSFLHHAQYEFGYVKKINDYIDHLPAVKEIILRGCGTAARPNTMQPHRHKVKLAAPNTSPYDKPPFIHNEDYCSLIVQQKVVPEQVGNTIVDKVYTKVSWRDPETKQCTNNPIIATNVALITDNHPTDYHLKQLEQNERMPLLNYSNIHIKSIRNTFFNPSEEMSHEELAHTKKIVRRANTETIATSKNDLLSKVLDVMGEKRREKVAVKAYISAYTVLYGRVVPTDDHGQGYGPKAVRTETTNDSKSEPESPLTPGDPGR